MGNLFKMTLSELQTIFLPVWLQWIREEKKRLFFDEPTKDWLLVKQVISVKQDLWVVPGVSAQKSQHFQGIRYHWNMNMLLYFMNILRVPE